MTILITIKYILFGIATILIAGYSYWRWSRRRYYELAYKVPQSSDSTLPFIGHGHHYIKGRYKTTKVIAKMIREGTPRGMWLGHHFCVGLNNPKDLEILMNHPDCMNKDFIYGFAYSLVGHGLLTAPVEVWRKHRKLIAPTFGKQILKGFFDIFVEQGLVFCEVLNNHVGREDYVDMLRLTERWTLDVICESAMGVKVESQTKENQFMYQLDRVLGLLNQRMANVFMHNEFIFGLTKTGKEYHKSKAFIRGFSKKVIKEKEEARKQIKKEDVAQIDDTPTRPVFLDFLFEMRDRGEISDKQLWDETTTFIIGGSDTTAAAVAFIFIMMGLFPECQEKVYEEVLDVLGPDRLPEWDDIPKLKYVEKFIYETMRIFPNIPNMFRITKGEVDLGHCVLPAGTSVIIAIMELHRSPKLWKDPLKFDPERFSPEEIAKRHPYCYIPFSRGARNCVGMSYSMLSMKTIIAAVARFYRFETSYKDVTDVDYMQSIFIKVVSGYPIKIFKRE